MTAETLAFFRHPVDGLAAGWCILCAIARAAHDHREAARRLSALSDRHLRDIGLTRRDCRLLTEHDPFTAKPADLGSIARRRANNW